MEHRVMAGIKESDNGLHVSVCECGYEAPPMLFRDSAYEAWQVHRDEYRAEAG